MGAIAFGTRLFGKVDAVGGKCHVSTLCWHFCYLPLVPLGTYVVSHEVSRAVSGAFAGVRIDFSWKSWLVAWVRVLLGLPAVIGVMAFVGMASAAGDGKPDITWSLVAIFGLCVLAVAGLWLATYYIPGVGRATARTRERLLLVLASVPPGAAISTTAHVL